MFRWLFTGLDRHFRGNPKALAWRLKHLPGGVLRQVQRAKLVHTLRYVYRHNPMQRELWRQAGIKLRHLRSPAILPEIPFCDRGELALHPERFFCVPEERMTHVITTAGTSGEAKKIFMTTNDVERQSRMIATKLRLLPGASRVLGLFGTQDPTWTSGAMARRAMEKAGMFGLLCGTHIAPVEQIKLIREYRIDTIISGPPYFHRLTLEAGTDTRTLGIKYVLLAGQAWTEELRQLFEESWNAVAIDVYGTNECACGIASECHHKTGLHVASADFWIEIVDPQTGRPLPEGQEGEVVVTTLSREGMPLVRYRIGDLATIFPRKERCACGVTLPSLSRIRGRIDDMIILGNTSNVFPDELDQAIFSVAGISDYQVVVEKDSYRDVLHLTAESSRPREELAPLLSKALLSIDSLASSVNRSKTMALGRIECVAPGTLSQGRPKGVRIIDKRA